MFNMTRLALPLAMLAAACADGRPPFPRFSLDPPIMRHRAAPVPASAFRAIRDALNAAWAAKDAAGYPAPCHRPASSKRNVLHICGTTEPASRAGENRARRSDTRIASMNSSWMWLENLMLGSSTRPVVSTTNSTLTAASTPAARSDSGYRGLGLPGRGVTCSSTRSGV